MNEFKMTFRGNVITCNKKVYFFDCGEVARTVSKIYKNILPIDGFISEDEANIGKFINGLQVNSLQNVIETKNFFIVVATNKNLKKIYERLKNLGLTPEKNFCHYKEYIRKYFEAVFNATGKLKQDYLELYVTDRCSLRCKSCILFAPRSCPQIDRNFDDVKRDVDLYFKFVDEVAVFRLMGGEPFLYNNIDDLLKFMTGGGIGRR